MHINYSFRGDNSAATFIEKHKVKHGVSKWWVTKNYLMKQCYETSLSQHMEKLLDVPKAPCRSAPFSLIHDGSHHKFAPICVGLAHEFHMLWEKCFIRPFYETFTVAEHLYSLNWEKIKSVLDTCILTLTWGCVPHMWGPPSCECEDVCIRNTLYHLLNYTSIPRNDNHTAWILCQIMSKKL